MKTGSIFNRSGFAALSDLKSYEHPIIFIALEKIQDSFLEKEEVFRSNEYKWPRDPLHSWSRVWEYPYVYYHLARNIEKLSQKSRPVVVDIGSGVTFFPFSLAKLGYEVICTDIDPICEKDLARAACVVPHTPGRVVFRLSENTILPFKNEECDALYCVSVLEHVQDIAGMIREMSRILKPEGLCIITCDIALNDDSTQLMVTTYKELLSVVEECFYFCSPDRTIHPADMLMSANSPYRDERKTLLEFLWQLTKQRLLKPLLGKKPRHVTLGPEPLAVFGLALRKRYVFNT